MGEVFSRDQPHQLQPVQCQLVCCNNWVVTAVSNMEVSQMLLHYVTWLSTNQILSHDLHPIRFCHMTFIQSDFVTWPSSYQILSHAFIQSDFVTWPSSNQILSHDFQPIRFCHMTFSQLNYVTWPSSNHFLYFYRYTTQTMQVPTISQVITSWTDYPVIASYTDSWTIASCPIVPSQGDRR